MYEDIEKKIENTKNDIEKIDLLNELSYKLSNTDVNKALELCEKSYDLSKQYKYKKGLGYSLRNKGLCDHVSSNFKEAFIDYFEALNVFQEIGNKNGESNVITRIGSVYYQLGNYSNALEYHLKSLQIAKNIKDKKGQADSLNNIALVFNEMKEYNRALIYNLKSLKIEEDIQNVNGQAISKNNIGNIYKHLGNFDQALEYFFESLDISKKVNDKQLQCITLKNIGNIYEISKDYENSLIHYNEGLNIIREVGNQHLEARLLRNIAQIYIKQSNYKDAIKNLEKAFDISNKTQSKSLIYDIHRTFSEAYELVDNYKEALKHYKIYHNYEQEVFDEELRIKTRNIIVQFEIDKIQKIARHYKKHNIKLSEANKNLIRKNEKKSVLVKRLLKQTKLLEKQINIDFLTGLYNRGHTEFRLTEEYERATRHQLNLSIAYCDIDSFKEINDDFSHLVGDEVLKKIASIFKHSCRSIDILGRYGGDEFILIFPKTNLSQGGIVCERIRSFVESYDWTNIDKNLKKVSISIGLAEKLGTDNYEELFAKADSKLYEAKNQGKNKLCY